MTSVRYGIRTALRAKGRTRLFALLILILTLALVLGVGIWSYCAQLLERFDETYTSIVLAEYMGEDYPDENAADEMARSAFAALDDEAITAVDGVTLWERTDSAMLLLEGYKRSGSSTPSGSYGVIVASNLFDMEEGYVSGRITKSLYTKEGKDGIFSLFDFSSTGLSFSKGNGKKYLLHGQFVDFSSNRMFVITDFYEGCETKPWLELSGDDDPALTDSLFTQTADYYRMVNNAAHVIASDDIASLELFQQGTLYLEDGRFPAAGEPGVCLLSGSTAEQMDISVGDTVNVSMLASSAESRNELTGTDDDRVWKVVGITNKQSDYSGVIWVSKAEGNFPDELFGYELGRAVLDNSLAVQATAELEALMPDQVRLTLYDQGYSSAVKPIRDLYTTAIVLTVVTACGALAVLFLFAYLFVGRQRETVRVMTSLGTPGRKIRLWLLSGASLIALTASAVGTVSGYFSLNGVTAFVLVLAQQLFSTDTLYSNAALGVIREAPKASGISVWYALAVGAAVFLASLILCLVFLRQARREDSLKKGKTKVRLPKGKTSLYGKGAARFSLLSAKRGGWRSKVVPAAVLVLTILIGMLTVGASGWSDQLNDLYENSKLEGQVVSLNGRNATQLNVSAFTARKLWESGYLSDISVTVSWNYWMEDEIPTFADNGFGMEARDGWISKQPVLAATNSLSAIPEFYYTDRPEIEWLEGYDESFLADTGIRSICYSFGPSGDIPPVYPVLAGKAFMEQHGLEFGDETRIMIKISISTGYYESSYELPITLRIVGAFRQAGQKSNLYVPLAFWFNPDWLTGETEIMQEGELLPFSFVGEKNLEKLCYSNTFFRVCRFTLASTHDVAKFRNFLLEESYSQVGRPDRNRTTILLMDQEFTETLSGLRRYITFGSILFPLLFIAVAAIGFIISWLMINGRRMEFAILRGLGASRRRVFATFFIEQAMLCVLGCLIGALILTVLRPSLIIWLATAVFIVCYLAGCALSIRAVGNIKLIELLSERE